MTDLYYFAFGMNLAEDYMPLGSERLGPARLDGYRFRFQCFADVQPCEGAHVYGGLWKLPEGALDMLDRREGYPEFYDRRLVPVRMQPNDAVVYYAWVYFMRSPAEPECPYPGYLSIVEDGYREFGMPVEAYEMLRLAQEAARAHGVIGELLR